ncbi:MAG: CRISPR-associated protein [Bacteroidetes bacterium]|nr:CRISPR-associated protein [Bacteroidota bacterium]
MLINCTNHPSAGWSAAQTEAAAQFGEILDVAFPAVSPAMSTSELSELAEKTASLLKSHLNDPVNDVVLLMGEMSMTYSLVRRLREAGIRCLATTSERDSSETGDGRKLVRFSFVRFREYE